MTSPPGADGGGEVFRRVAAALRNAMSDGTYTTGSLLPTQRELAERFEVSKDTIRRVMKELASEGWIEARQGSGTRVIKVQRIHTDEEAGPGLLRTVVREAFGAEDVTLDVFSLTAETLSGHLTEQVQRVREGEIAPRSITVRLLLPDEQMTMPYPSPKDGSGDDRLAVRMHELSSLHSQLIKTNLEGLRRERLVPEMSWEIRRVRLTPHSKLYLFNGTIALQGYYKIVERRIELADGEELDTIDVLGLRAVLFRYVKDGNPNSQGSVFFTDSQEWFDSVWDLLASPEVR
ncbi:GntR family transcriptional regulator [Streptomyces sp. NBC_00237]|uniref:GntR family transcriptional regulator n=1 Tax=Streptomyces sp. NBC_00237 TaxID=2975687 RepID=UPI0022573CBA|nr:GntR family transcriptional regulator [Streptomyces sp. NBC_00237]MCX5200360.1 GntR family transcriptional regulator [Streptomyces sp. NBC_00237]